MPEELRDILDLIRGEDDTDTSKIRGIHPGVVVDNNDPEKRGRLRVQVSGYMDDITTPTELPWSMPCILGGAPPVGSTTKNGSLWIPKLRSIVWVAFYNGDIRFPIWLGSYYGKPGGSSQLPNDFLSGYPEIRGWISPQGNKILIDDTPGSYKITIKTTTGNKIEIDETQNKMVISDSTGTTKIELDLTTKKVTLESTTISLGSSATEAAVLGTLFMTLFNSHTHNVTAIGAPTGVPIPLMTTAQLATKTKVS